MHVYLLSRISNPAQVKTPPSSERESPGVRLKHTEWVNRNCGFYPTFERSFLQEPK